MDILAALSGPFGRVTHITISEPIGSHAHPHVHLLFNFSAETRRMAVEGRELHLDRDHCILVNPWQEHHDLEPVSGALFEKLVLYIEPEWLSERLGGLWQLCFEAPIAALSPRARELAVKLRACLTAGSDLTPEGFEETLLELLEEASRPVRSPKAYRGGGDYRIRQAVRLLRDEPRLRSDFSAIARDVGLSRSRFFEQFRAAMGITPSMYVQGIIIEEAIRQMAQSTKSLAEIASGLGFAEPATFTRFFKKRVGFTPITLRRRVESVAPRAGGG